MIFETERLLIRKLNLLDINEFHRLENTPSVVKYGDGTFKNLEENYKELNELIFKYSKFNNDFWIYAIEKKIDSKFIGTVALVKDNIDDEIGYRFIEEFWGNGYGFEVCKGLVTYSKKLKIDKLVAYVANENIASVKILERLNFNKVPHFISEEVKIPETKYQIIL